MCIVLRPYKSSYNLTTIVLGIGAECGGEQRETQRGATIKS
jgi:hypothetical protein